MNILYVVTQGEMGGAQKYVLDLASAFEGQVACGREKPALLEKAKIQGLPTHSLRYLRRSINPLLDILAVFELRKLIRKLAPDIVHINSSKAGVIGTLAALGTNSKVVYTAHGFVFNEPLPFFVKLLYAAVERFSAKLRDFTITVSARDYQTGLKHHAVTKGKVKVIHNGIASIDFVERSQARKHLACLDNKIVFGSVGYFYPNKGFDILIDAVSTLPEDVQQKIQVVVIGTGQEFENCKLKIQNLGLTSIFILPGLVPEASRYLKAFDVFVLPSRKEGFSYTILEAMQAGLPIVATRVGGIPEAVGAEAILVEPQDPHALARALELVTQNPTERERLGHGALERSAEFNLTNMLGQTEQVYQAVMNDTTLFETPH